MLTVNLSFPGAGEVRKPGQFWAKQVLTMCGSNAISQGVFELWRVGNCSIWHRQGFVPPLLPCLLTLKPAEPSLSHYKLRVLEQIILQVFESKQELDQAPGSKGKACDHSNPITRMCLHSTAAVRSGQPILPRCCRGEVGMAT